MASQKKEPESKSGWSNLVNSRPKKIIVSLIGIVLVLNILWTLKQNDTSSETPVLKEELAKLEQRIVELEKRAAPDVESLRADFEAVRQVGAGYEARLKELLKAEEEHLAMMKAELEANLADRKSVV